MQVVHGCLVIIVFHAPELCDVDNFDEVEVVKTNSHDFRVRFSQEEYSFLKTLLGDIN